MLGYVAAYSEQTINLCDNRKSVNGSQITSPRSHGPRRPRVRQGPSGCRRYCRSTCVSAPADAAQSIGKISDTASNATKQRERFFPGNDSDTFWPLCVQEDSLRTISGRRIPGRDNKPFDYPHEKSIRPAARKENAGRHISPEKSPEKQRMSQHRPQNLPARKACSHETVTRWRLLGFDSDRHSRCFESVPERQDFPVQGFRRMPYCAVSCWYESSFC